MIFVNRYIATLAGLLCALALIARAFAAPIHTERAATKHPSSENPGSGSFTYLIEPVPSWVTEVPEAGVPVPSGLGMHYALVDHQIKLERERLTDFHHVVRVVDGAAGLGPAAQIQLNFDPTYQTFVFHRVEVVRGGRRIDRLDPKNIELLHRETQLEYRMVDGQLTASIVLDDIRVGDRIEYSYSLRGSNPVFDGRFVLIDWPSVPTAPTSVYRLRLLAPESRDIHYRAGPRVQVFSTSTNAMRETLFTQIAVPQLTLDPQAPESVYLENQIQLSEYADWADVAGWGRSLFGETASESGRLRAEATDIAMRFSAPEDRLRAALEFVQTEVRYFGREMGESSHRPTSPEKVLERRFGDCKDKVSLLIALLHELRITANPVLVSTHYRADVASMLPSPLDFDHVIARVAIGERSFLLDATRAHQTGPLDQRQSTGLGEGLELMANVHNLVELPGTTDEERIAVEEAIHINAFTEDPVLQARITYSGELAESMREALAREPLEQIETRMLAEYGRFYPKIHAQDALDVVEEPNRNAITLVQHYALSRFWQFPEEKALFGEVGLWSIAENLQVPNDPERSRPYRIPTPGVYRHHVVVDFPEDVNATPGTQTFDDEGVQFDYHLLYTMAPHTSEVNATLRLSGTSVSPEDWPAYAERTLGLRGRFIARVPLSPTNPRILATYDKQLRERLDLIRAGKWTQKVVTPLEVTAATREVVLNAWLAGNRLEPELRAQVLRDLGTEHERLGWNETADHDFEEAIRLDPKASKSYEAAALNAFLRGKDDLAIEQARHALSLAPSDPGPRSVLGFASYFKRNYPGTREDMLALLKTRSANEQAYPALWIYLAARHLGEDASEAVRPYAKAQSTEWPYPILHYLTGSVDLEGAKRAAANDLSHLCELYFYAGEKNLLDGDAGRAREFFQKSVDTGVVEFSEYEMAQRSLAGLQTP